MCLRGSVNLARLVPTADTELSLDPSPQLADGTLAVDLHSKRAPARVLVLYE